MATHRFEVTPVSESTVKDSNIKPAEIIPLIQVESEIPSPPPVSNYVSTNNGKTKQRTSSRLYNKILQRRSSDIRRRATIAAANEPNDIELKKSLSVDVILKTDAKSNESISNSSADVPNGQQVEEPDVYSTIHSMNYDTNPKSITNKFLQEIRLKRRELREKSKNVSIDQRIAFNRRQNQRQILHAQDIFDVHFEQNDDYENEPILESNIFTEEFQEKARNDIYSELNRQRMRQYNKQYRQLILGRALFMVMTALLAFMSLTLLYVLFDLLGRSTSVIRYISDETFVPMNLDPRTNLY